MFWCFCFCQIILSVFDKVSITVYIDHSEGVLGCLFQNTMNLISLPVLVLQTHADIQ